MVDCRSPVNGRITLLHYAVKLFKEKYEDIIEIVKELNIVNDVVRLDISPVVTELNSEIVPSIKELKKQLKEAEEQNDTRFVSSFGEFYKNALLLLEETKELSRTVVENFSNLVSFYAEDSKMTFKDIVQCIHTYLNQFERAIEDNIKFEQQQLKKQLLQQNDLGKLDERGILENALGNLRAGATMRIQQ